ncbi:transposase [Sphingobium wenxiniae]|nr:transposase [Sphingobium wenxiniae]MBB6193468.1 transposase [Sphingobium wenxiniae]
MSNGRRRYDPAGKDRLVESCLRPGVSVAGLALQHGVNANLLRKWVEKRRRRDMRGQPVAAKLPDTVAFVRVETPPVPMVSPAGGIAPHSVERLSSARLQASMPNGVTLTLEGCDPQLFAVMIGALGRCDVPPVA